MNKDRVIDDVKRMFDDPAQVAERLREQPESYEVTPTEDAVIAAARQQRHEAVGDGISGLDKVAEGREEDITEDERFGMEAIILLTGRPAIFVQDGDFLTPPAEWNLLNDQRAAICAALGRVGRVEVRGHLDLDWVGTAWLGGPHTAVTNRHVAIEFSQADGGRWSFRPGMSSRLDLREEMGSVAPLEFEVTGVIGVHEQHDLALLRVEATSPDGQALPDPLPVAATAPDSVVGQQIYTVGYPAWDGRRNEPEPMRRIFMDVYNVKRLQPGQTTGLAQDRPALRHDCSTLGGNSGSPVISLDDHRVIGLHFGGRYGIGNYAVPLWTLTDDPLLRAGAVNFQ